MRVNVYAEEMTERVEIIGKEIDGRTFTGCRFYLELPASMCLTPGSAPRAATGDDPATFIEQCRGPFLHRPGDDDSSAVTFWGKRDLRPLLQKALALLDEHYAAPPHPAQGGKEGA